MGIYLSDVLFQRVFSNIITAFVALAEFTLYNEAHRNFFTNLLFLHSPGVIKEAWFTKTTRCTDLNNPRSACVSDRMET